MVLILKYIFFSFRVWAVLKCSIESVQSEPRNMLYTVWLIVRLHEWMVLKNARFMGTALCTTSTNLKVRRGSQQTNSRLDQTTNKEYLHYTRKCCSGPSVFDGSLELLSAEHRSLDPASFFMTTCKMKMVIINNVYRWIIAHNIKGKREKVSTNGF